MVVVLWSTSCNYEPVACRSGLLVFSEDIADDDDNDDEGAGGFQTTPIHAAPGPAYQPIMEDEMEIERERTSSNSSQQIGRFEVCTR